MAMKCHYEVLGVERTADADVLKKAYRKLALVWHPDKNRSEEAEARFKEINAAYELLSDPQERAWYDDHRESILRGGDGTAGDDAASFTPNLWPYFSGRCFNGFGDDEEGFYAVYAKAFDEIISAELERGQPEKFQSVPSFGTSADPVDNVRRFYSYFENFTSTMSFGWADVYNPFEVANNRYQRRIVDRENNKARTAARKEYSENVRSLARYARKRDKRTIQMAIEAQQAAGEKEKARLAAIEEKKQRSREAREAWIDAMKEEEERIAQIEAETGQKVFRLAEEHAMEEEDDDSEDEIWKCELCTKTFKSEKQFHNHEKSKKHLEAVKKLQKQLRDEEAAVLRMEAKEKKDAIKKALAEQDCSAEQNKSANKAEAEVQEPDKTSDGESDSGTDDDDSSSDGGFGAFGRFGTRAAESSSEEEEEEDESVDAPDEISNSEEVGSETEAQETNFKEDEEGDGQELEEGDVGLEIAEEEIEKDTKGKPGVNKKKGKVSTSAQQKSATEHEDGEEYTIVHSSMDDSAQKEETSSFFCGVCNTGFSTRNQLFKHIKKTNHAVPLEEPPAQKKSKGKKGKKGK